MWYRVYEILDLLLSPVFGWWRNLRTEVGSQQTHCIYNAVTSPILSSSIYNYSHLRSHQDCYNNHLAASNSTTSRSTSSTQVHSWKPPVTSQSLSISTMCSHPKVYGTCRACAGHASRYASSTTSGPSLCSSIRFNERTPLIDLARRDGSRCTKCRGNGHVILPCARCPPSSTQVVTNSSTTRGHNRQNTAPGRGNGQSVRRD